MESLLQKFVLILLVTLVSCQDEQIIETPNSDRNITPDSVIFDALAKTSNNDTIECINFIYPITFSIYDSNNQVLKALIINNDDELKDLLNLISSSDFDGFFIELNYPLSLVTSDNTTITVNNNQELVDTLVSSGESCVNIDNLFACVFNFFQLDFIVTDTDNNSNDGITSFTIDIDLDCDGVEYDLSYFETLSDAQNNTNKIVFPYTNASNPQKLYARAETHYFNQMYDKVFEVNVHVIEQQSNDVCPSEYTSYFLTQCKWTIENFSGSTDYSDYAFTFKDDGTFTVENSSSSTTENGTWAVKDTNGMDTTISMNFNSGSILTQLSGNWNVQTCDLNTATAAFDIEFSSEAFTLTMNCN